MVFWRKQKKEDFKIKKDIVNSEALKNFLRDVDADFIKVYCFPSFLCCAYFFGSEDMKKKIEEMIDSNVPE